MPHIVLLVDHLIVGQELCRVPVEAAYVLAAITCHFRRPLTRVRPRIENALIGDSSLLSHLQQSLFGHIILLRLLSQADLMVVVLEAALVLLNDRRRIHLSILWLLLEEKAVGQVVLLGLESSKIFNRFILLKAVLAAGAVRVNSEELLSIFLRDHVKVTMMGLVSDTMAVSHGAVA